MKEIHEFRIFDDYYHLLPQPNGAVFNGLFYVLQIQRDSPLFLKVKTLDEATREKYGDAFFGFWDVTRSYTKKELAEATLFHMGIKQAFEPAGEECGTIYDEDAACEICGANRKQIGPLRLMRGSIPKKDIARTIAGEVVVSEKFAAAVKKHRLKGILLEPTLFGEKISNYFQLTASTPELELSEKTIAGHNIFNLSSETTEEDEFTVSGGYKVKFEKTVFKCPKGHLIGARLISEPYVKKSDALRDYDFFTSRQKIGAKQGILRPESVYFCSQAFRSMVMEEKLAGFDFEIAHIVDDESNDLNC